MASNWYVDSALGVLSRQIRAKHPGIVIGTIGDQTHFTENPDSDHIPEADGSVDAIDLMIGPHFTKVNCDEVINALVASRDFRIKYIIWQGRIISSTVEPWVWRPYNGKDRHTGHAHISRNDRDEKNTAEWRISMAEQPYPKWIALDDYSLPELKEGMDDKRYSGYNDILRLQDLVGADMDGNYGPKTSAKVKARVGYGNGKTVGLAEWVIIYGLSKR